VVFKIQGDDDELTKKEADVENTNKKDLPDSTIDSPIEKPVKHICENCDLCVNCQKVVKIFNHFFNKYFI
jgi:hypothetical protein